MGEEGRAGRREEGEDRIDLTSDSLGGNRKNKASTRRRCWGGEVGIGNSLRKKKEKKRNPNKPRRPRSAKATPARRGSPGRGPKVRPAVARGPLLLPPRARAAGGPARLPPPAPREPRRRVTDLQLSSRSLGPRAGHLAGGRGRRGPQGAQEAPARHWGATLEPALADERPEDPPAAHGRGAASVCGAWRVRRRGAGGAGEGGRRAPPPPTRRPPKVAEP